MNCENCGIEFDSKRKDAKYCSPKCRVTASRKGGVVTDNVTFSSPDVTDNFKFYTQHRNGEKSATREARYWYDVPLSAIPVKQKDWPDMPEYLNGRQYFLWWKNNFEMGKKGPIIHNPFPVHDAVKYEMGGEGARKWGA